MLMCRYAEGEHDQKSLGNAEAELVLGSRVRIQDWGLG